MKKTIVRSIGGAAPRARQSCSRTGVRADMTTTEEDDDVTRVIVSESRSGELDDRRQVREPRTAPTKYTYTKETVFTDSQGPRPVSYEDRA